MNKHTYNPACRFQLIEMPTGEQVFVSTEDFELVIKYDWHIGGKYAVHGHTCDAMHYMILGIIPTSHLEVHHKDHNKLNNTRENLVVLTLSQHQITRPTSKNSRTGYKGVTYNDREGKYKARIGKDKKQYCMGTFDKPEDAARAYDKKAKELFGNDAYLNFP